MTESENLTNRILQAIQGQLGEIRAEQREQRVRLSSIERHLAHMETAIAELGSRFDRVLDRLDRLETRSGLIEA